MPIEYLIRIMQASVFDFLRLSLFNWSRVADKFESNDGIFSGILFVFS